MDALFLLSFHFLYRQLVRQHRVLLNLARLAQEPRAEEPIASPLSPPQIETIMASQPCRTPPT